MLNACEQFPPDVSGDETKISQERAEMSREADAVGTLPPPVSVKGMIKTSFNKMIGNKPEIFLDKLGERLAFERTGVRLYEAVISKAIGLKEKKATLRELEKIRHEEAQHMVMVKKAIKELGADPTAMTPCADITGVMGSGLLQVVTDPRANMAQALNALLNAELIDNAGWELLIELAYSCNQDKFAKRFEKALKQEAEHLFIIKNLLKAHL